jgi:hypothetical protein
VGSPKAMATDCVASQPRHAMSQRVPGLQRRPAVLRDTASPVVCSGP